MYEMTDYQLSTPPPLPPRGCKCSCNCGASKKNSSVNYGRSYNWNNHENSYNYLFDFDDSNFAFEFGESSILGGLQSLALHKEPIYVNDTELITDHDTRGQENHNKTVIVKDSANSESNYRQEKRNVTNDSISYQIENNVGKSFNYADSTMKYVSDPARCAQSLHYDSTVFYGVESLESEDSNNLTSITYSSTDSEVEVLLN